MLVQCHIVNQALTKNGLCLYTNVYLFIARFILRVKKGYRHPPYHNWMHAFSVTHYCYCLYKSCPMVDLLSPIEILALFVSCMCHDIDHRGTNNAFQLRSVRELFS